MKHDHNHDNAPNGGAQLIPVHFQFTPPTEISVRIGGSLNHWHLASEPMRAAAKARWLNDPIAPGTYQYCFGVDGQWVFSGDNSILQIEATAGPAHLPPPQRIHCKPNH